MDLNQYSKCINVCRSKLHNQGSHDCILSFPMWSIIKLDACNVLAAEQMWNWKWDPTLIRALAMLWRNSIKSNDDTSLQHGALNILIALQPGPRTWHRSLLRGSCPPAPMTIILERLLMQSIIWRYKLIFVRRTPCIDVLWTFGSDKIAPFAGRKANFRLLFIKHVKPLL